MTQKDMNEIERFYSRYCRRKCLTNNGKFENDELNIFRRGRYDNHEVLCTQTKETEGIEVDKGMQTLKMKKGRRLFHKALTDHLTLHLLLHRHQLLTQFPQKCLIQIFSQILGDNHEKSKKNYTTKNTTKRCLLLPSCSRGMQKC